MSFSPKTGRSCIAAALLVVCLATTATAAKWYESYEKGVAAFDSGRWTDALNYFNQAIEGRDDAKANAKTYGMNFVDYVPYAYRGTVHAQLGHFDKASSDLSASKRYGAVAQAQRNRGAKGILRGLETAVEILGMYEAAVDLLNQGNYQGAIDGLNAVLSRKASVPGARDALARAEAGLQEAKREDIKRQDDEAEKQARQKIKRVFERGVGFFDRSDLDSAETLFKQALRLDPSHKGATGYLGRIKTKRDVIAQNDKDTRDRANREITSVFERGVSSFDRSDLDSAETLFNETLKLDPSHIEAAGYLGRIKTKREVIAQGNKNQRDRANRVNKFAAEGKKAFDQGQLRQAKQKFDAVIALDRSHSESTRYLDRITKIEARMKNGVTSFLAGDLDRSIQHLNQAAGECRDEVVIFAVLACAYASKYFLSGEQDREHMKNARDTFAKARKLDKNYKLKTKYVSPKIARMLNGN